MTPQDPGVYISPAQMYQEMRSLHDALTRVEGKVDSLAGQSTQLGDHETRIRVLERARWPLPTIGALAGLAGAGTSLVALFQR